MKVQKIIFIVVFLAILVLPAVFFNYYEGKVLSIENRGVAKPPVLKDQYGSFNADFNTEFETFLNDNTGFKEQAILANIIFNDKIFGEYAVPHYLVGKDNNLFYVPGDVAIPESLPPYPTLSDEQLTSSVTSSTIIGIANFFKEKNVHFLYITIPDKENVYPELYPDTFLQKTGKTRLSAFVDFLNENTDIYAYNLTAALVKAKESDTTMLYYKNYDPPHWNGNGAFIGYTEIMNKLKAFNPKITIYSKNDFSIKETPTIKSIKEYTFSQYADVVYEYSFNFVPKSELVFGYTDWTGVVGTLPDASPVSMDDLTALKYSSAVYYYVNSDTAVNDKLLVVGDSYLYSFILPFIAESYSEMLFIHLISQPL